MRSGIIILFLVGALFMSGCTGQSVAVMEKPSDEILQSYDPSIALAMNRFGFSVYHKLINSDKNIMISPLSISMALGMTLAGTEGDTAKELSQAMNFGDWPVENVNKNLLSLLYFLRTADPEVILTTANSAWMKAGFSFIDQYKEDLGTYYLAHTQALDFTDPRTVDTINGWVKENTQGLITEIVKPPIDPLTVLYLINSTYFKGSWSIPFDPDQTQDGLFYRPDGSNVSVPMMHLNDEFLYMEDETIQMISLPYGDNQRIVMNIVMPKEMTNLDSRIGEWNVDEWLTQKDKMVQQKGSVVLPRFTVSYETSLVETMKALGVVKAFDPYESDFSRMISPENRDDVSITDIIHKTKIIVDEKGTEAAAVTSVEIGLTSIQEDEFTMTVNRPFLFLIEDQKTGALLFIGHVVDPS